MDVRFLIGVTAATLLICLGIVIALDRLVEWLNEKEQVEDKEE